MGDQQPQQLRGLEGAGSMGDTVGVEEGTLMEDRHGRKLATTPAPSNAPSKSLAPSRAPSRSPSRSPSKSLSPSHRPSSHPTDSDEDDSEDDCDSDDEDDNDQGDYEDCDFASLVARFAPKIAPLFGGWFERPPN